MMYSFFVVAGTHRPVYSKQIWVYLFLSNVLVCRASNERVKISNIDDTIIHNLSASHSRIIQGVTWSLRQILAKTMLAINI
jgi:predicted amidohydrolase